MSTISERLASALGGSYTIERELTGGGMALVFVADDHDLDRKVARSVKRRNDTVSTAKVDARLVLEGTVERVRNRPRVTARLSNTADDVMQWADVYDRDVKDIFAVKDEIAEAIVVAVTPMAGQLRA